jgi:hypothetical protein
MRPHRTTTLALLVVALAMVAAGCGNRGATLRSAELVESIVNASLATEPPAVAQTWRDANGPAAELACRPAGDDAGLLSLQAAPFADDALPGDPLYPGRWFIGARGGANAGSGEPANDIPAYGLFARYRLRGPWLVGLALDQSNFDFEQPGNLIDVNPVGVVDASIDSTSVTAWGEYEFRRLGDDGFARRVRPFVGAGVGVAFLGDDDLSGATETGGAYDLDVRGGLEIIPGLLAGLRIDITRNLVFEIGARYDFHLTDLSVRDNVSGNSADVDDYSTYGGYVGLQLRL